MSQQFVPFKDYMDRTGNHVLSMARLAKDVLAEIPDQLISYMKSRGIKPNLVPPAYSTADHPQTNPVWAPHTAVGVRSLDSGVVQRTYKEIWESHLEYEELGEYGYLPKTNPALLTYPISPGEALRAHEKIKCGDRVTLPRMIMVMQRLICIIRMWI